MSAADKRLERLQSIAGALADQALQPVVAATANVRRIEGRIAAIAAHRKQLAASTSDATIAGAMLSQAERLRRTQAEALTALASARVALEVARRSAAKAVGRDQALTEIAKRRKAAELLEARRRLLR